VLYECLTGNTPYPGDTLEQQITAHLTAPPPCPSSTDPNIPVAFDTVIATGMAKTPDERYQTTVQLSDAARNAITSSIAAAGPTMQAVPPGGQPDPSAVTQLRPPPQPPQPSSGQETHRPRDRRVWWGAIAGGMAVIAVVVTVVVMTNRDSGAGSASAPSSTPAPTRARSRGRLASISAP
jgi:serine/threonine protein kinase